jgi:hypothetical protein
LIAQCLQILRHRFTAERPGFDVINMQLHRRIRGWGPAAEAAFEMVAIQNSISHLRSHLAVGFVPGWQLRGDGPGCGFADPFLTREEMRQRFAERAEALVVQSNAKS